MRRLSWLAASMVFAGSTACHGRGGPRDECLLEIPASGLTAKDVLRSLESSTGLRVAWAPSDVLLDHVRFQGPRILRGTRSEVIREVKGVLGLRRVLLHELVGTAGPCLAATTDFRLECIGRAKAEPEPLELDGYPLSALDAMDGVWITTTLRLPQGMDPDVGRETLRRCSTGDLWGNVRFVQEAQLYVVRDFAPNVAVMARALRSSVAVADDPRRTTPR